MTQHISIMYQQRGFSLVSFVAGILLTAILAAGVAFYITKTPVPFVDRFTQQEPLNPPANWNPNTALQQGGTRAPEASAPAATQQPSNSTDNTTSSVVADPNSKPVPIATVGNNTPPTNERVAPSTTEAPEARASSEANSQANVQFYVQAGAFTSATEAEQQRAKLALLGSQAVISQVTAAGRTMHRVRIGPYSTREAASIAQRNLANNSVEAAIVLVQQ